MSLKKKIIYISCVISFVGLIFFGTPIIKDYLDYQNVVKATESGSCPMIEGARSLTVTKCVRDTPVIPVLCTASCPLLDPALVALCAEPVATALECIVSAPSPPGPAIVCADSIADAIECQACETYYEVKLSEAQFGNIFYGIPMTFTNYKGGGKIIMGQEGSQNIFCGNSNIDPIVMGIPSVAVNRIEKVKDWFNTYIIAGFKD